MNRLSSLLLTIGALTLCSPFWAASASAAVNNPVSYEVKVSATIGEPKLTLYGWGPTETEINLTGLAIAEKEESDENGFFIFTNIFLPAPHIGTDKVNYEYPELCLQSVDNEQRSSQPTCIPPLPDRTYSYNIGPVLLSPIISLDKGKITQGEQAGLKGLTTPYTPVNVFLANQQSSPELSFNPVKTAYAYYIPEYQTVSDKDGYFEFNLPNKSRGGWNIFAAAETLGADSPKSNTLAFSVISPLSSVLQRIIGYLIGLFKPCLLYIIILLELIILAAIIISSRRRTGKEKRPNIEEKETT